MSNSLENLYRIQRKDLKKASMVLSEAFQDDPAWSHIAPDEKVRKEKLPIVFEFSIRYALHYGEVYSPTKAIEGVAIWTRGRYATQTFWRVLRSGAIISALKMGSDIGKRISSFFEPVDADREANITQPYMYLVAVGISPEKQGQGLGSKLLRPMFERLGKENIPIYLETETKKNAEMYKKYGFQVVKEGILHNLEFYLWEMIRKA
jgi:ribosomal protein S18 acetylase RimI-like enzyme